VRVLFVSSEVVPFAKTGGLADVAGSLPKSLRDLGHDVRVFMPRYKKVDIAKFGLKKTIEDLPVELGSEWVSCSILESMIPGSDVPVYFLENWKYFGSRDELYTVAGKDYDDNLERFSLFCKAAIEFMKKSGFRPDIIHCNDWQSALLAAYIKVLHRDDPFFSGTSTVYSIHNMGYQGLFSRDKLPLTGFGWDQFTFDKLEFWGNIALTKAGFVYADVISTVSDTYSKEIQTEEYGHGLDGLLRSRSKDIYGIVNGIDYDVWDPETDPQLKHKYSAKDIAPKLNNKIELQKASKLPQDKSVPVIGLITRLADQKGFDILAEVIDDIMHLKCQLVILGTGEPKYHDLLTKEMQKYPDHISVSLKFDAMLAQLIYAGCDMFLMPSRYEPCGLGQLISFKYGTVPIVRKTGGLADTVEDYDPKTKKGSGFVFEEYSGAALLDAVKRSIDAFGKKTGWNSLVKRIMKFDHSWDASAKEYVGLYKRALSGRTLTHTDGKAILAKNFFKGGFYARAGEDRGSSRKGMENLRQER
jgi:starch synthase